MRIFSIYVLIIAVLLPAIVLAKNITYDYEGINVTLPNYWEKNTVRSNMNRIQYSPSILGEMEREAVIDIFVRTGEEKVLTLFNVLCGEIEKVTTYFKSQELELDCNLVYFKPLVLGKKKFFSGYTVIKKSDGSDYYIVRSVNYNFFCNPYRLIKTVYTSYVRDPDLDVFRSDYRNMILDIYHQADSFMFHERQK